MSLLFHCSSRLQRGVGSTRRPAEEPLVFQLIEFATNKCGQESLTLFDLFIARPRRSFDFSFQRLLLL